MAQRNFGLYFGGSLLSNIGSFFQIVAQSLLMYQLTHSSLAVGFISFAQSIGTLVLGPWAGTVADRSNRRRLIIITQAVSLSVSAALAGLTFAGQISVPWLVIGALALGLARTFSMPVMYSYVPALVPASDIPAAMQMNSVTFNIGRVAGPILGVLTVNVLGYGWAFLANAVSFLALLLALFLIHPSGVAKPKRRSEVRDLVELLRGNRRIPVLLLIVVAVVMTYDPIQTLAPGLVQSVFGVSNTWVGWFLGAIGAGAIIGTLLHSGQPTIMKVCGFLGLFGMGMLAYALAPTPWAALIGPLVGGAGYLLSNTGAQVLLLREAGDEQSGQVMALFSMAFSGVRPLVSLLDGALADGFGIRQAGVAMTFPALIISLTAGFLLLRKPRPMVAPVAHRQ